MQSSYPPGVSVNNSYSQLVVVVAVVFKRNHKPTRRGSSTLVFWT